MLDNERATLKENAGELANLLTENVPYLLSHYLENKVLTESEREAIVSAGSAQEIRVKLIETLADKEGISLEDVIEGLNATDNHSVSKEIISLFPDKKKPMDEEDGSGDKVEDVSVVATSLVDEVIAKAEDRTNSSLEQDQQQDNGIPDDSNSELNDSEASAGAVTVTSNESSPGSNSQDSEVAEEKGEEETIQKEEESISTVEESIPKDEIAPVSETLVETSVEVHKTEEEPISQEPIQEEQVERYDAPDRNAKSLTLLPRSLTTTQNIILNRMRRIIPIRSTLKSTRMELLSRKMQMLRMSRRMMTWTTSTLKRSL